MFSAISHFVFSASSLFGTNNQADGIKTSTWKDKKLCFDLRPHELELDRGEQLIGCYYPVEDVKGNQDELGVMKVTNLRLIWICCKKKRVNLSIGWRTVTLAYEQNLKDALSGSSTSLFVLSKYESTKYEFVFRRQANPSEIWSDDGAECASSGQDNWNSLALLRQFCKDKAGLINYLSPMYLDDPFEVVFKVWQAYKQTHLFRHCRSNLTYLVGASTSSDAQTRFGLNLNDIQKLPSEEIIEVYPNVAHNESRSIKHIGTLVLTNIRILWIDDTIQIRNFSIPYIRVDSIKPRQGDRLQVNTHDHLSSSKYVEFQTQKTTPNGLISKDFKVLAEQIQSLHQLYKSRPRYGPESCDDSLNFMSHLRPVEQYFDSIDKSMVRAIENFGPEANTDRTNVSVTEVSNVPSDKRNPDDDDVERAESDLSGYTTKMVSYLNEQPLNLNNELIYSTELGLAMEKPANGASINSIWKIYA